MKVFSQKLTESELTALLAMQRARLPFAVVESPDAIAFPATNTPLLPAEWPQGKAFGDGSEVRWSFQGTSFHILWISNAPPGEGWSEVLDLTPCQTRSWTYFMWSPNNVALGKPPDYQALPPGQGHPQILVEEYRDAANGAFVFARAIAMQREGNQ